MAVKQRNAANSLLGNRYTPYLYLVPIFTFFILFFLYPFLSAIYYSFTKWNMIKDPIWIGMRNYYNILLNSGSTYFTQFYNGMGNTLLFVLISVPPLVILPLFVSILLNYKMKGSSLFQSIFYLPSLFSVATIALMWLWILDGRYGAVNRFFNLNIAWANQQPYTWIAIVVMTVWWTLGVNMVIYVAGMGNISSSLYEAASIDGAGEWQKFRNVTLPGLKNQFAYTIVMTTIASFNIFGQTYMFSEGGPMMSTKTITMYIREYAFTNPQAGISTAMSMMLGIVIFIISLFQYRYMDKDL
ncbi:MAG: sugar ABC transporter permease [Clostridia bacterium]